jgi:hypothetical protein
MRSWRKPDRAAPSFALRCGITQLPHTGQAHIMKLEAANGSDRHLHWVVEGRRMSDPNLNPYNELPPLARADIFQLKTRVESLEIQVKALMTVNRH